ncbi:MAG: hypothetical protein IKR19_08225 [Acholeplasmatales bacterium]|nr:hypothetical protein [Acholeplasmatales bacterium]
MNELPVRYTQSIYKQYTIFLKDQEAQKAAAAEDMMEELEDGGMSGGISYNNAKHPPKTNSNNMVSIREEQLAAIRRNLAQAENQVDDFKPAEDPQTTAIREAQLAKLQADIMGGNNES